MYAGHVAAGLALRGRARDVPVAAFVLGAFVLDLLWIIFGVLRLDHTPSSDWSHSLLMAMCWATIFAALFWEYGPTAVLALWASVFSHYILDLIVQGASLYPDAPRSLHIPVLVSTHPRLLQLGVCTLFVSIFLNDERRAQVLTRRSCAVACVVFVSNGRFLLGI
jgi:hypothetical protein